MKKAISGLLLLLYSSVLFADPQSLPSSVSNGLGESIQSLLDVMSELESLKNQLKTLKSDNSELLTLLQNQATLLEQHKQKLEIQLKNYEELSKLSSQLKRDLTISSTVNVGLGVVAVAELFILIFKK